MRRPESVNVGRFVTVTGTENLEGPYASLIAPAALSMSGVGRSPFIPLAGTGNPEHIPKYYVAPLSWRAGGGLLAPQSREFKSGSQRGA